MEQLIGALPPIEKMSGAIVRLTVDYPQDWEIFIDDAALVEYTHRCFEFRLVKRPQIESRIRLPGNHPIGSLSAAELVNLYWSTSNMDAPEAALLTKLAADVIRETEENPH
jgi:hypothetical protein